jgi:hypothetical protein
VPTGNGGPGGSFESWFLVMSAEVERAEAMAEEQRKVDEAQKQLEEERRKLDEERKRLQGDQCREPEEYAS